MTDFFVSGWPATVALVIFTVLVIRYVWIKHYNR